MLCSTFWGIKTIKISVVLFYVFIFSLLNLNSIYSYFSHFWRGVKLVVDLKSFFLFNTVACGYKFPSGHLFLLNFAILGILSFLWFHLKVFSISSLWLCMVLSSQCLFEPTNLLVIYFWTFKYCYLYFGITLFFLWISSMKSSFSELQNAGCFDCFNDCCSISFLKRWCCKIQSPDFSIC